MSPSAPTTELGFKPDDPAPHCEGFLVNPRFQLAMLRRVGAYGLIGAVYVGGISLATSSMTDPTFQFADFLQSVADESIYWAPGLLFLVPALAVDWLRFTRRYAAPIRRLADEMHQLLEGTSDAPFELESNEPWCEIADIYNQLREELLDLRQMTMLATKSSEGYVATQQAPAAGGGATQASAVATQASAVATENQEEPYISDLLDQFSGDPVDSDATSSDATTPSDSAFEPEAITNDEMLSDDATGMESEAQRARETLTANS